MLQRYLEQPIRDDALASRKMAFIWRTFVHAWGVVLEMI
jgi:hypothetical protein